MSMRIKQALAGTTLAALLTGLVPAAPALADGRASTRNILLGAGVATYLIIQHNRRVHAQRAEEARRQAAAQNASYSYDSGSNSYGSGGYQSSGYSGGGYSGGYSSAHGGYSSGYAGGATTSALRREVSYQHRIIMQQRAQLARAKRAAHGSSMVDYGWGRL